tara:strand:+ start:778 stop:1278 length:501 start_codon:yes stop_codon:yes gene_type:complete
MRRAIALVLVYTLIFPAVLFADPPEPTQPVVETPTQPSADIPSPPRIMGILEGQPAPYNGVLLSTTAAARLFVQSDYSLAECNLRINYEVNKERASMQLLLDSTRASLDSMRTRNDSVLTLKDQEIKRLTEIASEGANDYSVWWAAGGIVVGIALTIGVVYAVKEQ